jgi:hypothetical protein
MHAEHTEVLHVITVGIVYKSDTDTKLILIKYLAKNRLYKKRLHDPLYHPAGYFFQQRHYSSYFHLHELLY